MQKSIISWTKATWNPVGGCSRISDGCKFCYAATLSSRYGWTKSAWTLQNEEENVTIKPHKLGEPYSLKEPSRVFVNSMSDLFHRVIPDWYRAAVFNVMLALPQHTFQILTKRADATVDWHTRYLEAVKTPEYQQIAETHPSPKVRAALKVEYETPWGDNLWMGTSVEDHRVLHRIDSLRQCQAKTRFLSCEPLIGALGNVDLSGIAWVICGGESGSHLTDPSHPRWMKQEWARELRDACVAQGVAYFYKQDSGKVTEQRPYLVEADGTFWRWWQYPGDLAKPVQVDAKGEPLPVPTVANSATVQPTLNPFNPFNPADYAPTTLPLLSAKVRQPIRCADCSHDFGTNEERRLNPLAQVIIEDNAGTPAAVDLCGDCFRKRHGLAGTIITRETIKAKSSEVKATPAPAPKVKLTSVVDFRDVKDHWDKTTQKWDSPDYVYIGRFNKYYNIPESKWHNPYFVAGDTSEAQARINVDTYRLYIKRELQRQPGLLKALDKLRGKTLVCWCKGDGKHDAACHGDVLLELLGEKDAPKPEAVAEPVQMSLF